MFIIIEFLFGSYQDIYISLTHDNALQLISSNRIREYLLYQVINDQLILLRSVNENGYKITVEEV